ncbi:transposase [Rhodopirellula islandica]|uniref:transposase n=1 Tax=Rhodopirellula islandica TaxID=595434 RepID=UPI00123778F7|nr:transposase [Rhodopirellula islandica]
MQTLHTRLGTIRFERWYFQTSDAWYHGLAPLDVRLGVVDVRRGFTSGRLSPALADAVGRLAAEMPQQAAIEQIAERFDVKMSVDAYRRNVDNIHRLTSEHSDEQAIEQLILWTAAANQSQGERCVLLQLGRDGVHVPLRPGWKESGCATLSLFDRKGRRLGTIYLGEAPRKDQLFLTRRLDRILKAYFTRLPCEVPVLRYVTDAGALPQSYFKNTLAQMKHPVSGEPLSWSWGVDFFHACEYLTKLGDGLFGSDTNEAHRWAEESRRILRHQDDGVSAVIRRAAQQERRHGLKGKRADFDSGLGYLKKYRPHMDYQQRRAAGEPIGSGITEAGCKVIFNQRFKQSGMRWKRDSMQAIIDLRATHRSGLWKGVWRKILFPEHQLPPINRLLGSKKSLAA